MAKKPNATMATMWLLENAVGTLGQASAFLPHEKRRWKLNQNKPRPRSGPGTKPRVTKGSRLGSTI